MLGEGRYSRMASAKRPGFAVDHPGDKEGDGGLRVERLTNARGLSDDCYAGLGASDPGRGSPPPKADGSICGGAVGGWRLRGRADASCPLEDAGLPTELTELVDIAHDDLRSRKIEDSKS